MAVTPGLKAAAGIKKGDSMTVQRKLWDDWKKNKENDTGDSILKSLEPRIKEERAKSPNAFLTASEAQHMQRQFDTAGVQKLSAEAAGKIAELRDLRTRTELSSPDLKSFGRGYGYAKEFEDAQQAKIQGINRQIKELSSPATATVKHPTFGTTYVVTKEGLNKILSKKGNIQTDQKKASSGRNSRKSADVKGLKSIKDDRLTQMTLF